MRRAVAERRVAADKRRPVVGRVRGIRAGVRFDPPLRCRIACRPPSDRRAADALRSAARDPGEDGARRRRLAARDQVRRLSDRGRASSAGAVTLLTRAGQRLDGELSRGARRGRGDCRCGGAARRRGGGGAARRPHELPGAAERGSRAADGRSSSTTSSTSCTSTARTWRACRWRSGRRGSRRCSRPLEATTLLRYSAHVVGGGPALLRRPPASAGSKASSRSAATGPTSPAGAAAGSRASVCSARRW